MLVPVSLALFLAAAPHVSPPAVVSEADVDPPLARLTAAEARFLRARSALAAGDAAAAERELSGLAAALPAIADRVEALLRGRGRGPGAPATRPSRRGSGSPRPPSSGPRRGCRWGGCRPPRGDPSRRSRRSGHCWDLPAPGDLSRGDAAPRALLFAGKVLSDQPDGKEEARKLFLECWAGHALSPEAKECRARPGRAAPASRRSARRRGPPAPGRGAPRLEPERAGPRRGEAAGGEAAAPGPRRPARLSRGVRPGKGAPEAPAARRRGRGARPGGRGLHATPRSVPGRSTYWRSRAPT